MRKEKLDITKNWYQDASYTQRSIMNAQVYWKIPYKSIKWREHPPNGKKKKKQVETRRRKNDIKI